MITSVLYMSFEISTSTAESAIWTVCSTWHTLGNVKIKAAIPIMAE